MEREYSVQEIKDLEADWAKREIERHQKKPTWDFSWGTLIFIVPSIIGLALILFVL